MLINQNIIYLLNENLNAMRDYKEENDLYVDDDEFQESIDTSVILPFLQDKKSYKKINKLIKQYSKNGFRSKFNRWVDNIILSYFIIVLIVVFIVKVFW